MSPEWKKWQIERLQYLVENGMPESSAKKFAYLDAKARERIGKVTGFAAAAAATITFLDRPNGETIWTLLVDPKLIPLHRRSAAKRYFYPSLEA